MKNPETKFPLQMKKEIFEWRCFGLIMGIHIRHTFVHRKNNKTKEKCSIIICAWIHVWKLCFLLRDQSIRSRSSEKGTINREGPYSWLPWPPSLQHSGKGRWYLASLFYALQTLNLPEYWQWRCAVLLPDCQKFGSLWQALESLWVYLRWEIMG